MFAKIRKGPKGNPGMNSCSGIRDAVTDEDILLAARIINSKTWRGNREKREAAKVKAVTLPKVAFITRSES